MTDNELLQAIYNDTQELKQKVSTIEDKVSTIEDKVSTIEDKVSTLEDKVTSLEDKVSSLEDKISTIESDITDIKFTIENEIRVNIKRVAEGHLDLSRDLKEVMKPSNEFEMLTVRVNILESDVRRLKEKIS